MIQLFIRYFKDWKIQVFPSICIFLYVMFTGTDLYTTYLATPDLKMEGNPIILYFGWKWQGLLLWAFSMLVMTISFAVLSNKYILKYFENKKQNITTNKLLFFIFFLLLVYCYHNLIASFEATIHNYLGYRYLFSNSEGILQKIAINYAEFYIKFDKKFGIYVSMYVVTALICLLGTLTAIFQVNRVKKYVQSTFST